MTDPSGLYQKHQQKNKLNSPEDLDARILSAAHSQAEVNAENNKAAGWAMFFNQRWMPGAATAAVLLVGITFAFNFESLLPGGNAPPQITDSISSPVPFDVVERQADFNTEAIQLEETAQLEEIVLTARKREESLADVPVSISVIQVPDDSEVASEDDLFDFAGIADQQIFPDDPQPNLYSASPASATISVTEPPPENLEAMVATVAMAAEDSSQSSFAEENTVAANASKPESLVELDEILVTGRYRETPIQEQQAAIAEANGDIQLDEIIVTGRKKESFFGIGQAFSRLFSREESGPDLIEIRTQIPDVILDIQYAGADNFVGEPIDGYNAAKAMLSEPALAALANVQEELREQGLGLKIFDAYRPQQAVDHFIRWSQTDDQSTKATYYPNIDKPELFSAGYLAERSSHSRGSTVDVTIVKLNENGAPEALDMGTIFDFFDPTSWPSSTGVSETAQQNRRLLQEVMVKHGFEPFETEWWHFTLANEPYPDQYFDLLIE